MRRQKLDASGICAAAIKEVRADGRSDCSAPGRLTKVPRARLRCCQLCVCRAGKRGRGCVPDVDHIIRHLISSHLTSETDRPKRPALVAACLVCTRLTDIASAQKKNTQKARATHGPIRAQDVIKRRNTSLSPSLYLSVCLSVPCG